MIYIMYYLILFWCLSWISIPDIFLPHWICRVLWWCECCMLYTIPSNFHIKLCTLILLSLLVPKFTWVLPWFKLFLQYEAVKLESTKRAMPKYLRVNSNGGEYMVNNLMLKFHSKNMPMIKTRIKLFQKTPIFLSTYILVCCYYSGDSSLNRCQFTCTFICIKYDIKVLFLVKLLWPNVSLSTSE